MSSANRRLKGLALLVLAAVAAYVLWLGRFRSEVGSAASIQDVPWIGGQLKPLKTMGEVHYYYLFQPREELVFISGRTTPAEFETFASTNGFLFRSRIDRKWEAWWDGWLRPVPAKVKASSRFLTAFEEDAASIAGPLNERIYVRGYCRPSDGRFSIEILRTARSKT